ncbi:hypothetical protein HPB50_024136 [Hyalomma asiaticum]|uniref:Uncharacterized protein n=1 Tax=Hyalomma asiaticum TaxID=266040 RepID=A0ACB7TQF2_HYAAI|nr:hypothetical protein HPB50_024136 [Hyalomma asiaticum]
MQAGERAAKKRQRGSDRPGGAPERSAIKGAAASGPVAPSAAGARGPPEAADRRAPPQNNLTPPRPAAGQPVTLPHCWRTETTSRLKRP